MSKVAVIGSGAMGLAAAYHALKHGHQVTVYEVDDRPGGMAAHFDFDGLSIERFYHFVCKADQPTFDLMTELGIGDKMRWRDTHMGYYIDGELFDWGEPKAILKFNKLNFLQRLRYGAQMFFATKRSDWKDLEKRDAKEWLTSLLGEDIYNLLWKRLFELKFYEFANNISAAWIWTRIKRVGTSRKSPFQEQLGYIDGGTETLVKALVSAIEKRGGKIKLCTPVKEITIRDNAVQSIVTGDQIEEYDHVISTVPTPYINPMIPGLPKKLKESYAAINNIGVVCVLLKLKKSVTKNFWLNVNDQSMEIPGLIEFSRLRPVSDHIIYVPYYMPQTHPKFSMDSQFFIDEAFSYICAINPSITKDDLISSYAAKLKYAQPICEPGFLSKIPPIQTGIKGLQIADTCFYYPEDRGISESVRYGKMMAEALT